MKDRVLELLSTPTEDPDYPNPRTFVEICELLDVTPAERFQVSAAIIELRKENKIVQVGNLFGVDLT